MAIVAGGCGGSDDAADEGDDRSGDSSPTTVPSTSSTSEPTTNSTATADPDPADGAATVPARAQLDWVVSVLDDGGRVTVDEIEERFSPTFLAQVPAEQLVAIIPDVFQFADPPFVVERFDPAADGLSAEAVLRGADDRRLSAQIGVGAAEPNLIEGLSIVPTELEFPTPIAIDAIDERLTGLGSQSSLGVYEVSDGDCRAVHELRTDGVIVLGSTFKLWVLAALANEVDEGRASWDETVAVTDALRSSPDGDIYELETGTEVTLERLAEAMISISDNTATDLLIDRLGRETVEAALDRIGVADPAANVPMLSTGNLFALKFVADEPNADDYRSLDEDGRRALLADLDRAVLPSVGGDTSLEALAEITNVDGVAIGQPRDLDLEWFATAEDLCRTLVHLGELAEIPGLEPVASILEINSGGGLPFDRDRWPTIRFKGGSEPGVVAGAWWFEGPEGDRYVVAGGVADPDTPIDELTAVLTLASAIELVE